MGIPYLLDLLITIPIHHATYFLCHTLKLLQIYIIQIQGAECKPNPLQQQRREFQFGLRTRYSFSLVAEQISDTTDNLKAVRPGDHKNFFSSRSTVQSLSKCLFQDQATLIKITLIFTRFFLIFPTSSTVCLYHFVFDK